MSSPSPTSFSLVASATTAAFASSSPSDASSSHSGPSATKIAAVVIPVIVIVSVTLYSLAVAGGIMHHHRRGTTGDAESSTMDDQFSEKWIDPANEPKLWEVSLKSVGQDDGDVSLRPLAMEMHPAEKTLLPLTNGTKLYTQATNLSQRKLRLWPSFASTSSLSSKLSLSQANLCAQPAQVAVIVAMPFRRDGSADATSDFALGTRPVLYETTLPPPTPPLPPPTQNPVVSGASERSVILSMSAYGYFY